MSGGDGHDPLATLNLLDRIQQARTADDCFAPVTAPKGLSWDIDTVKALNSAEIEALYVAFDNADRARRLEHEQ